jgi:hypothetical protein
MNIVRRFNDVDNAFDDNAFEKIASVVEEKDKEKVLLITPDENKANVMCKQLNMQGYNAHVEQTVHGDYKVIGSHAERLDLRTAMASGKFKKLAWGRYCFQRNANETLGNEKYDFDDGSIWKVIKDEDGHEYLVKEVDDKDEDKVIRNSELKAAASKKQIFVNEDNAKNIVQILYNFNNRFVDDMLKVASNETIKMLNNKLNECIAEKIAENKFISSPKYLSSITASIESGITDNKIKNMNQLEASVVEFTNKFISDTNS